MSPKNKIGPVLLLLLHAVFIFSLNAQTGQSIYTERLNDPQAVYFTTDNYGIANDGKTDVTQKLQDAINALKSDKNYGIVFIPEGTYLLTGTVFVPNAIRLVGYGKKRPVFILESSTPGYQDPMPGDKSGSNYLFWFTGDAVIQGKPVSDANSAAFYSGFSNIDIRIGEGNPNAVALCTHYVRHGVVSHCDIYTGSGKAGIYDAGNEIQNVRFFGGDYGILTTTASSGWPFFLVDSYFEGQRNAAVSTRNVGLTIVNMHAKDVPVVIDIEPGHAERLFMENCLFENVRTAGISLGMEDNSLNQINLRKIDCRNVPVMVSYPSTKKVCVSGETYRVIDYAYGLIMDDINSSSEYGTVSNIISLKKVATALTPDIPSLPRAAGWVNLRELGAAGDGLTDDTEVFNRAIDSYDNIYVPQGRYRVTETLKMKLNTCFIGLHPYSTQIMLDESSPAFSGFGPPKPLIETAAGGNAIFSGIGINTGSYNYRAVGIKWMAGEGSLMNDVKFIGDYGDIKGGPLKSPSVSAGINNSSPSAPFITAGIDPARDNQYWSLWITGNGGGTFKNIWTEGTFAASGLYVSNTSTPGKIYAMSLEHHVRNEARFSNVSNWKVYAIRQEEDSPEGSDCIPVELVKCGNITFADLWLFRGVNVKTPKHEGVRLWDCTNIVFLNMHNYAQVLQAAEIPVYDFNRQIPVFPREFARLTVTGHEKGNNPGMPAQTWAVNKIASGFEFAQGITTDSKGNIYFCETRLKRIYKWSAETKTISLLADYPWEPFTLACDTKDNLIVIFRYDPQPGYIVNGVQETVPVLPDDDSGKSGGGNGGWAARAYSVNPDYPDETMEVLPRVSTAELIGTEQFIYPSGRWRHDFDSSVIYLPLTSFVAPDHITAIPETYDLRRSAALSAAFPGEDIYISDERLKRTVRLKVEKTGKLTGRTAFVPRGEFSSATDIEGNIYIADGLIYIYGQDGSEKGTIKLDERPVSIAFGDEDKRTLFVTTSSSLYCIKTAPL